MKGSIAVTAATAALASAVATPTKLEARQGTSSGKTPAVSVKGNAFFAGNERFYIKGIDYQPGGSSGGAGGSGAEDPIADLDVCQANIKEFVKLGINTVRVYTVDNSKNHDACMNLLSEAGIYLALDVNSPDYSINRADPGPSYNDVYLQSVFATIDAFAKYDNTLLFFSGNEVINADNNTNCAPYVKATTRDMKSYINSQGYRKIPVGYSAADVESNRYEMAQYMNCGTDDQRSDFFAFNDYSWCDPSSYEQSGWNQKVEKFSDYSIPLFLSEYGCITNKRTFDGQVEALYGNKMSPVYSGGLVYEYSEEGSGYGLVEISGTSITEKQDFQALAKQYNSVNPSGDGGYKPNGSPSECPAQSDTWEVSDFQGEELPAIPKKAMTYMRNGAGTAPGLDGPGSQNAGGSSTGTAQAGSGSDVPSGSGSGSSSDSESSSEPSEGAASSPMRDGGSGMSLFACGASVVVSMLMGAFAL